MYLCTSLHLLNGIVKGLLKLFAYTLIFCYLYFMKRKQFTTTIQEDALKDIKKLAIDLDRSVNDLLEEAIEYLLKKYEKKDKK